MVCKDKAKKFLATSDNGVITAGQATAAGFHRGILTELAEKGEIYRYSRGIYVKKDTWEDDLYLLQQKYKKGIFSHGTALYLLDYSDRTPALYTMTFPKGYNAPSLKRENLIVKRVVPDHYSLGVIEIKSPFGNPIYVYNLERTLCDIVWGNGCDIQIVSEAMKRYATDRNKNIHKLMGYAEKLRVKAKVARYMEVLL